MQSPKVRLALALVMIFTIYNEKYNISLLSVKVSSSVHQNAFFFSTFIVSAEKNEEKAQSPFSDDDRANRATRDQKVRTEQQRGWMFRV